MACNYDWKLAYEIAKEFKKANFSFTHITHSNPGNCETLTVTRILDPTQKFPACTEPPSPKLERAGQSSSQRSNDSDPPFLGAIEYLSECFRWPSHTALEHYKGRREAINPSRGSFTKPEALYFSCWMYRGIEVRPGASCNKVALAEKSDRRKLPKNRKIMRKSSQNDKKCI